MTFKTKKIIGHILLIQIIPIVIFCWYEIHQMSQKIQNGKNEILLSLKGTEKEEKTFNITYPYNHGVYVLNARVCEEGDTPSVIFDDGTKKIELYALTDRKGINFKVNSTKITVIPVNRFNGEIIFKNTVCGCEGIINLMYFIGGGISSLLLILIASLFYFLANKQKKALLTSPNVEEL